MSQMKCPYCGNEMIKGKICALGSGAAMEWKDLNGGSSFRLNTEKGLVARLNGDRIEGCRCEGCRKIILDYE